MPDNLIYQLRVSLMDVQPLIWRRVLVPGVVNLSELHEILQIVMGWQNYHLHRFHSGQRRYSARLVEDSANYPRETWAGTLHLVMSDVPTECLYYEYDFGDGWIHEIRREKVSPAEPGAQYPICIDGERRCPPEDCGGSFGYQRMLEALRDKDHSSHKRIAEWIGQTFDPEEFDQNAVNRRLMQLRLGGGAVAS